MKAIKVLLKSGKRHDFYTQPSMQKKPCAYCGKTLTPTAPRQKYHLLCSAKVRSAKETARLRKLRGGGK